ncbi:prepilin-type N-terminal cleavage/methylation domain-containing protein [Chloroflexota bacterium]
MRLFGNIKSSHTNQQAGFTLIEAVVSIVLLGLIGVAVLRGLETNTRSVRILEEQVQTMNLATGYLETIKGLPFDTSDPPYPSTYTIPKPPQYIVEVDAMYSNDGETWNGTYSGQKLQNVIITVSREGGKTVRSFCIYKIDFPGG